jgi:hypothetical protein
VSAEVDFATWDLPDDSGEILAVYVDGVELARGDWAARGARVSLRTPIPVAPPRRGETLAEALVWVGRYPPRPTVTALVRRTAGTDVVDARPAA